MRTVIVFNLTRRLQRDAVDIIVHADISLQFHYVIDEVVFATD